MQQRVRHSTKRVQPDGRQPLLSWNGVALLQGVFYLVTGLWPLLHIQSFLKVTGPKTDLWLVKTLGVLISVIGVVLGSAGVQRSVNRDLALLGGGSAAALTAIDVIYVARRCISPVYLLDAVTELALIVGWSIGARKG
jgi:hypothetical protein